MFRKSELTRIGKGYFTEAFKHKNGKVILYTTCPVKLAIAEGIFVTQGYLLPKSRLLESNEDYWIIEMEHLKVTRALKDTLIPSHWKLYQWLRDNLRGVVGYSKMYDKLGELPGQYSKAREQLRSTIAAIGNYSDHDKIRCEISPRNVGVRNGRYLVLMDVFFNMDAFRKRERASNRYPWKIW